jgi:hypothetical protein
MGQIGALTSILGRIRAELTSFQTGYLEDLAEELSNYVYDNCEDSDNLPEALEAAAILAGQLEDTVACFEDSVTVLEDAESLLSTLIE